ncbi:MAG: PAS domain S-box protein [Desulfobacterales bacterium]|uniref:histidine kinase n=1 Tax=Candidatus Desulfatibia vada TaxID=2841696 RepID=A0A8J6P2X8_9BACT|nr:PAS domain S-box protein [Candidatus Desulfatibia vada]
MFDPLTVITIFLLYIGCLFLIALWVERKAGQGKGPANNAFVYSISLAVYCTSWTYYGSVGKAATSGMLFLTIYLGPTLAVLLWGTVLRKMVRIKTRHHITSIADFISARYDKSQTLAAIATVVALVGITPYIALQLKAVFSTFAIITAHSGPATSWVERHVDFIVVGLMIVFTIIFGVRRLDSTERHQGMITALAAECLVKLIAFLAAGIFVTYFMYDGFTDIFQRLSASPFRKLLSIGGREAPSYLTWTTYMILAMSAVMFLPRQFHVAVVENSDEKHIRTAMWLFPLYMFLINIFVFPIALGGLLKGHPAQGADTFVLALPLYYGKPWLAMLVFIGGFSAATGMIMISSMTLSTMVTNHLMLPLVRWVGWLSFLRRHLLKIRWVAVAAVLMLGYWFEQQVGKSYMLVNIGMISFASVLQFAPVILGGIFWDRGNKAGALLGLSAGFLVWFYTLLLPSFVKSGWISISLLEAGPWGITFLKPEHLFGLVGLDPISHAVFWTMLFNLGLYVLGSLYFKQSKDEQSLAEEFVGVLAARSVLKPLLHGEAYIDLQEKRGEIETLLQQYFSFAKAEAVTRECLRAVGIEGESHISISTLAELHSRVEKRLAGSIGTAAAHEAMREGTIFTARESRELSEVYGEILFNLKVTPKELRKKINCYKEREALLTLHADELKEKVKERNEQIAQRELVEEELKKHREHLEELVEERTAKLKITNEKLQQEIIERKRAEREVRKSEERFRDISYGMADWIWEIDRDGRYTFASPPVKEILGYHPEELIGKTPLEIMPADEAERIGTIFKKIASEKKPIVDMENWNLTKNGKRVCLLTNGVPMLDESGELLGYRGVDKDITENKRAEQEKIKLQAQLQRAEKMEVVGTLAGGVAHDLNNILSGVVSYPELLLMDIPEDSPLKGPMLTIQNSGKKAAAIVQDLLTLARRGVAVTEVANLKEIAADYFKSPEFDKLKEFHPDVQFETGYAPDLLNIMASPVHLSKTVMNLVSNAAEALPDGGKVVLSIKNQYIDRPVRGYDDVQEGDYVVLSVADNGIGICADNMGRIFEPFYTKKVMGRSGTGLGMAVVWGTVKDHAGYIGVQSTEGQGARFDLYFPVTRKDIAPEELLLSVEDYMGRGDSILIVDDVKEQREIASMLLRKLNYSVTTASSGESAVEYMKNHSADLLLLDMIMDLGIDGLDTYKKILEIHPGQKAIIASGFSATDRVKEAQKLGAGQYIKKPYTMERIGIAVRDALRMLPR